MRINKKKFQLKSYSNIFEKSLENYAVIFFFSRFGKFKNIKAAQSRTQLKNLNSKLMSKLITNNMFSGSSYLLISRSNFTNIVGNEAILKSLSDYQFFLDTMKLDNLNFKLQSVGFGKFYISPHLFLNFFNILRTRVISSLSNSFKLALYSYSIIAVSNLFVPFFYILFLGMLKVLFQPVKNLFILKNLMNNRCNNNGNS